MGSILDSVSSLQKDRIVVPSFDNFPLHKRIPQFGKYSLEQLRVLKDKLSLGMGCAELNMLQIHFNAVNKTPTLFELKLIDCYSTSESGYGNRAIAEIDIDTKNPYVRKTLEMYNDLRIRLGMDESLPRTFSGYAESGALLAYLNGNDTIVKTKTGMVAEFNAYRNGARDKFYLRFLNYVNDIDASALKSNLSSIYAYGYKPIALVYDEFDGVTPQKRMISASTSDLLNISAYESTEKCTSRFSEPVSKTNLLCFSERNELSDAEIVGKEDILLVNIVRPINKTGSQSDWNFLYCEGVSAVIPTSEGIVNGLIKFGYGFDIRTESLPIANDTEEGLLLKPNDRYVAVLCRHTNLSKVVSSLTEVGCKCVNVGRLNRKGRMRLLCEGSELMRLDLEEVKYRLYDYPVCKIRDTQDVIDSEVYEDPIDKIKVGIDRGFFKSDYCLNSVNGANALYPRLLGKKCLTATQTVSVLPEYGRYDNIVNLISSGIDGMPGDAFVSSARSALTAILKLVVSGVPLSKIAISADYFYDTKHERETSGIMLSELLGCAYIQREMTIGSVGTRFFDVDMSAPSVVPSYIAVGTAQKDKVLTPLFDIGDKLYKITVPIDDYGMPDINELLKLCGIININVNTGNVTAGCIVEHNEADSVVRGTIGNGYGFTFAKGFAGAIDGGKGDIILAIKDVEDFNAFNCEYLGVVDDGGYITCDDNRISQREIECSVTRFPYAEENSVEISVYDVETSYAKGLALKIRPSILILHDDFASEKAIHTEASALGFDVTALHVASESTFSKTIARKVRELIEKSDFLILAGRSDYSKTSGIYNLLKMPSVLDAFNEFLFKKCGLVFGSGAGAMALFKLGFLTTGNAERDKTKDILLTSSVMGEIMARIPYVRIERNVSPLLACADTSICYPVGCGGNTMRLDIGADALDKLQREGRVCARFVNANGKPTESYPGNPEGSTAGVTAICSPCGNVLGIFALPEKTCTLLNERSLMKDILASALKYFQPSEE